MVFWAALTALISSGISCIGDAPAEAASCPKLPVYFLANGFSLAAAPLRSGSGE